MRKPCGPVLLGVFLAICSHMGSFGALAATPDVTISATNVTMPLNQDTCSNGACTEQYGYSTFTLTSINGYAGGPVITCAVVNPPAAAKLPTCFQYGLMPGLPANGTISGQIPFIAPGQTPPPSPASRLSRPGRATAGTALAAVLLFGLGLRRRTAPWFTLVLFALGTLCGMTAINACGGNGNLNAMTAGTYSYVVTATDANAGVKSSTTISVAIP